MKKISYDLHIHSCLSPCGDNDMTPANIIGMACIKGLDVIAVTDHNSCKNCEAAMVCGEKYGITVIPGMELTTSEEVHVLCYFPNLKSAMNFDEFVYDHLMKIKNREDIFGEQIIYDKDDFIKGHEEILLSNSTDISFDNLYSILKKYNGIMIPAHIDKNANSLLHNLGFVPPDSQFTCVEIFNEADVLNIKTKYAYINKCNYLFNSDAHYLEDINEPTHFIEAKSNTREEIFEVLKSL